METATKTVEQMSEPFAQPDMQERFGAWAERAEKEARQEKKAEKSGPREISLKDRPAEEQEFIKQVGQKPPDESKDSAKERTEQRSDAKESEHPGAKPAERPASESTKPVGPIAADRYWQRKFENKEEHDDHWRQVDSRAEVILQFINSHPQKDQIAQGFRDLVAGKPKAWQDAFLPDLYTALAEVASPGEVFRHLVLQPADRQALRQCKNAQELRAGIQTIAKLYPASASQASAKPRAPKPPSEVGGRSSATDDDRTNGEMNFRDFSRKMTERYARHAR